MSNSLWPHGLQHALSITNSQSLLKLMSIELMMLSIHLIFCHHLLLSSIFPSIRVFSNESILCIRWPKWWSELITWVRTLSNSIKLWIMPCRAAQDRRVTVESSVKMWSTGEGNGKPLHYCCFENPMNSMKRQDSLPAINREAASITGIVQHRAITIS